MASTDNQNYLSGIGTNELKEFQTTTDIKSKATKEFGLKVCKGITNDLKSAYFNNRNVRFELNRRLANGKHDIEQFKSSFAPDGNLKYLKLRFKAIMMVATTIQRTVGRWMQSNEKIVVKAEDMTSTKQRVSEVEMAEFAMNHRELLAQLEGNSGTPVVKQDQFIPDDKEDLEDWAKEELKLTEEIKFETGINKVLADNGWFDVIKQKVLTDSATVGLLACETVCKRDGMILVEWFAPETAFYSDSVYPDFRDTTYRGRLKNYKIIELREDYPNISEEDWWVCAQKSSQYPTSRLYGFDSSWANSVDRPYDDWSVSVVVVYIKTSDRDTFQMKVTKAGSLMIDKVDKEKNTSNPNKTFTKKDKLNIYKGVYVNDTEVMLEWGLEKNMIRPQDPQEVGDVEFPISLFMYNMHNMRNLAIPEKIEEPVEQMIEIRLKIQQIIQKMAPPGNAYDTDAIQELDLGLGEGNLFDPLKLEQHRMETGNWYFKGRDAEGNQLQFPIRPMPNSEGLQLLQGLIAAYNHNLQVLRDEVGINENAEGQAAQPRVTNDNLNATLQMSFNATDYMYDAYLWLMEDVAKKIGCLLADSVVFGGKQYKKILEKEDVQGRIFSAKCKMMPTQQDAAYVDTLINNAMQTNPNFILYCNPFLIRRTALEDVKLAERRFYRSQVRALKGEQKRAADASKMNADNQRQSIVAGAQAEQEKLNKEAQIKEVQIKMEGENTAKAAVLNMFTQLYSKGLGIPTELAPLSMAVIQNVMLPLVVENEAQKNQIQQAMQQQTQLPVQPQQNIPMQ
jgi:hypothetical protein